VDKEANGLVFL